ncbi:MAG: hypothetical protein OSB58_22010 [Alphaproteobacteria bacterium]|nr:hypothetical protein [Alphaproteobacteria bacterium]
MSPIDPSHYAMLAARAMSHIVRGEYSDAADWAVKSATAPNAHVHARLIAAMSNELAGNHEVSQHWVGKVQQNNQRYSQSIYFEAFPFRSRQTRAIMAGAMKELGFAE